jgi:hypothetical protein
MTVRLLRNPTFSSSFTTTPEEEEEEDGRGELRCGETKAGFIATSAVRSA